MIDSLYLRNFKCFRELDIKLAPLTLLTGFNAAGKSTVIQTLLLLAQTMRSRSESRELLLNGPLVSLGSPGDVLLQGQEDSNPLGLGYSTGGAKFRWDFAVGGDSFKRSLVVSNADIDVSASGMDLNDGPPFDGLFPLGFRHQFIGAFSTPVRDLIYLGATRPAEKNVFPFSEGNHVAGDCGITGQFASWNLHRFGDDIAQAMRCVNSEGFSASIRKEVNDWLHEIFPGAEANVVPLAEADLVRLEFRTSARGEWQRPSNVGFGLSYAFPMLVAGMCSQAGQLLIVDSPEAHLHPRGQSLMGKFATKLANAGHQVVIETHSDHFLNGVRLALKNRLISPDDVVIYFFSQQGGTRSVEQLSVDAAGNLSGWPSGFFDQAEQDLATLAGWS